MADDLVVWALTYCRNNVERQEGGPESLNKLCRAYLAVVAERDVIYEQMRVRDECARSRKVQLAASEAARGRLRDALMLAEDVKEKK